MDDSTILAAGRLTEAMLGVGEAGVAHTLLPGAAEVVPAGEIMRRSHRALPATESSPKTRLSRGWWQQDQDVGSVKGMSQIMRRSEDNPSDRHFIDDEDSIHF